MSLTCFSVPESCPTQECRPLPAIGGGITGVGIARDAAMRGLRVSRKEAKDWGGGTSSRSSKLLHGGIRYLEKFQLGLVAEASRERRLHSEYLSPHLAYSAPFVVPVYNWSPHSLPAVWSGVGMYNALSLFRNHGTEYYGRESLSKSVTALQREGLKGGAQYHDVVMDDARIVLENVRSAVSNNAVAANYMTVRGFEKDSNGKIIGVWVRDISPLAERLAEKNMGAGADILVRAKVVVNATGPWSDYIRRLDNPNSESILRPTKGVHLVLPKEALGVDKGFVLTAKQDNRVFFTIPWFDRVLVGTTDTDYSQEKDGSLHNLRVNADEVDYLLEGVKRAFPNSNVGDSDIHSCFAGVRPLVSEGGAKDASAVSREHRILFEDTGLFTIAGGKYTTYRSMAEEMTNMVVDFLAKHHAEEFRERKVNRCQTDLVPLVPMETGSLEDDGRYAMGVLEEYGAILGESTLAHLQTRYGVKWKEVARIAASQRELAERIIPSEPDILAEATYARKNEMTIAAEDFFRRRTMLALKAPLTKHLDRVEVVTRLLFGRDQDLKPTEGDVLRWQSLDFRKKD